MKRSNSGSVEGDWWPLPQPWWHLGKGSEYLSQASMCRWCFIFWRNTFLMNLSVRCLLPFWIVQWKHMLELSCFAGIDYYYYYFKLCTSPMLSLFSSAEFHSHGLSCSRYPAARCLDTNFFNIAHVVSSWLSEQSCYVFSERMVIVEMKFHFRFSAVLFCSFNIWLPSICIRWFIGSIWRAQTWHFAASGLLKPCLLYWKQRIL